MRTVTISALIVILLLAGGLPIYSSQQNDEITEVSFERKGCSGPCPVDQVVFRRNGSHSYTGIKYVDRIGHFQADQGEYNFAVLVKALERVNYANLKEDYGKGTFDAPVISLSVTRVGKTKTVTSYNPQLTPIELTMISSLIECVVPKIRWKKVER